MADIDNTFGDDELRAFDSDGAIALRGVVSGRALERLQAAAERARSRPGGYWYNIYLWRDDPDFRACCFDSPLPELAARLLRSPKVNLLYDQLFVKPPSGDPTPWHHDLPYWPVSGDAVMSFWLALGRVGLDDGGLEFIRGSHRWGRRIRTFTVDGASGRYSPAVRTDDPGPTPDFEGARDDFEILHWDLEPGDAVAFHALTFHHAPANRSTRTARAGYSMRFMGVDVRYRESEGTNRNIFNPDLAEGDVMDSAQYPVVFPRGTGQSPTPTRSPLRGPVSREQR